MGRSKEKRGRPPETGEKANKSMRVSETTKKALEEYGLKPNREIAIEKLLQIVASWHKQWRFDCLYISKSPFPSKTI